MERTLLRSNHNKMLCLQGAAIVMKNRNLKIDTLRGIACILLVAYHVIGSNPSNGLKISEGLYREINDILGYIIMPLFTFLSGVVYAYRPFQGGSVSYIKKKARRLLIPMLTVGTSFAILQSIIPGSNAAIDNWYLLHIKPVAHFWFVESLFFLFILIVIFEKAKLFNNVLNFSLVLFAMSLLYLSPFENEYLSLKGLVYLAPYFLLGMGLQRYKLIGEIKLRVKVTIILSTIILFYLSYNGTIPIDGNRTLLALLLSFVSCIALYSSGLKWEFMARIGVYSYSIYIFHVFFTAGSRILLNKIGTSQLEIFIVTSLVFGIIGPIVIELALEKTSHARMLFLGKSISKK